MADSKENYYIDLGSERVQRKDLLLTCSLGTCAISKSLCFPSYSMRVPPYENGNYSLNLAINAHQNT